MHLQRICGRVIGPVVVGCIIYQALFAAEHLDVRDFVRQQYYRGIPILKASQYPSGALDTLGNMLQDRGEKKFWPNVVLTVGAIGGDTAAGMLIVFLESRFEGEIDEETYSALRASIPALGHAAFKDSQRALTYLLERSTLARWRKTGLRWHVTGQEREVVYRHLARLTVLGLSLTGKDGALMEFEKLRTDPAGEYAEMRQLEGELIGTLSDHLKRLIREGRDKVFAEVEARHHARVTPPAEERMFAAQTEETLNVKEARGEALQAFAIIARTIVDRGIVKGLDLIADNGIPLMSSPKARGRSLEQLQAELASNTNAVPRTETLLQEFLAGEREGKWKYGEGDVKSADGRITVMIPCVGSEALSEKHRGPVAVARTLGPKGELLIYMVKEDGKWYWNPFFW